MIQKILFSQPRPETAHNPYSRLEEQYGVQCDFTVQDIKNSGN